jgi:hypothetical protein
VVVPFGTSSARRGLTFPCGLPAVVSPGYAADSLGNVLSRVPRSAARCASQYARARDWRANFFPVGIAHSIVGGSAWEPTAWRAVQRVGWDALQHAERNLSG